MGGLLFGIGCLVVGIGCLIALQMMRAMLSLVFPIFRATSHNEPASSDVGGHDLFQTATSKLLPLGFDGPIWIRSTPVPGDCTATRHHATFRHREQNIVVWCGPPHDMVHPNRLDIFFTSALQDGRYAVSQRVDPYFEAISDEQTPAQTIPPASLESSLEEHRKFVAEFKLDGRVDGTSEAEILRFAGPHQNEIRTRLLESGRARQDSGIARPSFLLGLQFLWAYMGRPGQTAGNSESIPVARLQYLDKIATSASGLAPSQTMQWLLLSLSVLLSIAVGWPIFGLQLTTVLVAVIVFHELGHWLAMLIAGYKNPHVTLLPLLGGVTIGHESDPSAAKRAWVSLAGPLPGIVLGWAILVYVMTGQHSDTLSEWLYITAIVLLIINYLNILPIPPLDGSHVIRALLPARWMSVQVFVVLAGIVLGIYLAIRIDVWLLGVIASLQLLSIRKLWTSSRAVRDLANEFGAADIDERAALNRIMAHLETDTDKPAAVPARFRQARNILDQIALRPMRWGQSILVSLVFLTTVAVPVGAIGLLARTGTTAESDQQAAAFLQEAEATERRLRQTAASKSITSLLTDLGPGSALPPPATGEQIRMAEARIRATLPDSVVALFRQHNEAPALGVGSIDEIHLVSDNETVRNILTLAVYDDVLQIFTTGEDILAVPLSESFSWAVLGQNPADEAYVFFEFRGSSTLQSNRVIHFSYGVLTAYPDIDTLARANWLTGRMNDAYLQMYNERLARETDKLAEMDIQELLGATKEPSFVGRITAHLFDPLPSPASATRITELETRMSRKLPADHRRLLALYDGFPPLSLLGTEEIEPAAGLDSDNKVIFIESIANASLTVKDIDTCWVVGGVVFATEHSSTPELYATVLWCPSLGPQTRYISTANSATHRSLTAVIRGMVASDRMIY